LRHFLGCLCKELREHALGVPVTMVLKGSTMMKIQHLCGNTEQKI
jgi:hypothetical protein